jgi:hypothetical protein
MVLDEFHQVENIPSILPIWLPELGQLVLVQPGKSSLASTREPRVTTVSLSVALFLLIGHIQEQRFFIQVAMLHSERQQQIISSMWQEQDRLIISELHEFQQVEKLDNQALRQNTNDLDQAGECMDLDLLLRKMTEHISLFHTPIPVFLLPALR